MTAFVGTFSLVRLALRRDRVMLTIWLGAFVLLASSSAGATSGIYPDEAARVQASATFNSVQSLVALYGKVYDPTSLGALAMVKLGGLGSVFVALLSIILVVRHTPAEEETGRQELLGATVVGRRAPLTAAVLVAVGTNVVLAVLTGIGLTAAGLPASGSFAFGLAWGGVGIAFAAIAAVTAQLTSTARAATGMASSVLGVVYVLRAIGDTASPGGPTWVTWLSPVGWGQQFRPYAGERWWVALLVVGFAVVVIPLAYVLVGRRDLGAGLLPDRPGRAAAKPSLSSPLALAWRLQRGALFGWLAAFVLLGAVLGNIATSVRGFLDSPQAQQIFQALGGEKGIEDTYLAAILGLTGVIASAYGIQAANRLRAEETSLRAEPVLATGITRASWVRSHTIIALAGTTLIVLVTGASAGLAYGSRVNDLGQVGRLVGAAAAQLPAAWILTGVVVAGFGLVPRLAALGWAALGAFVVLGEIGPVLKLNQAVLDISPFAHSPKLPGSALSWTPMVVLTVVALALIGVGLATFRRRDVPVP